MAPANDEVKSIGFEKLNDDIIEVDFGEDDVELLKKKVDYLTSIRRKTMSPHSLP